MSDEEENAEKLASPAKYHTMGRVAAPSHGFLGGERDFG